MTHASSPVAAGVGQALLRAAVGTVLVAHGSQKLFGWFGGGGLTGTGKGMHAMGFRPAPAHAVMAGLGEAGSGAALIAGLATPAAGAGAAITMAVAAASQSARGFFAQKGGFEYPAVLAVTGAVFALTGAGPFSLDAASSYVLDRSWMRWAALGAVPAVVATVLIRRHRALTTDTAEEPAQP